MQTTIKPKDLSIESALLKALSSKVNYEQYSYLVDLKRVLPNTAVLLGDYGKYFNLYKDQPEIVWEEFFTQFSQNWHGKNLDIRDIEYYRDFVFPAISKMEHIDAEKALIGLMEKQTADKLTKATEKNLNTAEIKKILESHEAKLTKLLNTNDTEVHTVESADFEVLDKTDGIPWFLPSLQKNLMSISLGQFVVISADFGTGKSAFVISQAVHAFKFLSHKKDERPILYFNSEGTASEVLVRFLSNLYKDKLLGGFEEVVEKRILVKEKFIAHYNPNIFKVIQIADTGTFSAIKSKILKYNPALVIIDICDQLAKEEDVQSLKKLYDNLRILSAAACPIIATTQSGDTSYQADSGEIKQRKWLGSHALYGSKSGKGGAADSIITIGKEEENSNLRYISVPKKKRGSSVNIVCEFSEKYSNYKELNY